MATADITPNVVNRMGELAFSLCRVEAERDALGNQVRQLVAQLEDLQSRFNDLQQVSVSVKSKYEAEALALKAEVRELRAAKSAAVTVPASETANTNSGESDTQVPSSDD